MANDHACASCNGGGEMASEVGPMDCPDCGGAGSLPSRGVVVGWRARDIERALDLGVDPRPEDVRWLLDELRTARDALTEIIALAHDARDEDKISLEIRFRANTALGLYETKRA